jgi:hypothetical protein
MLSKNIYKRKKSLKPINRKKNIVLSVILGLALLSIGYGIYKIESLKPPGDKKVTIKMQTGNQPLNQTTTIYINASGGLSLRKSPSSTSARLVVIPNDTKLTAASTLDGWYQVTYDGQTGWVSAEYTTTQAPTVATDPTAGWSTFSGADYSVKYPLGWDYQNYGASQANNATSLVAFSDQTLPTTVPTGSQLIAPVTIEVSSEPVSTANSTYSTINGVVATSLTIAGVQATEYSYTSPSSDTQVTSIVFSAGGNTFIMNESGGYSTNLLQMASTLTL